QRYLSWPGGRRESGRRRGGRAFRHYPGNRAGGIYDLTKRRSCRGIVSRKYKLHKSPEDFRCGKPALAPNAKSRRPNSPEAGPDAQDLILFGIRYPPGLGNRELALIVIEELHWVIRLGVRHRLIACGTEAALAGSRQQCILGRVHGFIERATRRSLGDG